MGSYIEENLARDEKIIIKAQVTWLSQFWYLLFGFLFSFIILPLLQIIFLFQVYKLLFHLLN